jgi:hypothetical protein
MTIEEKKQIEIGDYVQRLTDCAYDGIEKNGIYEVICKDEDRIFIKNVNSSVDLDNFKKVHPIRWRVIPEFLNNCKQLFPQYKEYFCNERDFDFTDDSNIKVKFSEAGVLKTWCIPVFEIKKISKYNGFIIEDNIVKYYDDLIDGDIFKAVLKVMTKKIHLEDDVILSIYDFDVKIKNILFSSKDVKEIVNILNTEK